MLFSHIDNFVNSQKDPFLVKAVLRLICSSRTGTYLKIVPQYLGVDKESIDAVLNLLEQEEIIKIESRMAVAGEGAENYAFSKESFGYETPDFSGLTREEALSIMKSAEPLVKFHYKKEFQIPLKDLQPLEQEIKNDVKALVKKEERYIRDLLNLPEDSSFYMGFAKTDNPTWKDGAGYVDPFRLTVDLNYPTVEDAFNDGIDDINGILMLKKPFIHKDKRYETFPFSIKMYNVKESYEIVSSSIGNVFGLNIWEMPIVYQKQGLERVVQLINTVKKS